MSTEIWTADSDSFLQVDYDDHGVTEVSREALTGLLEVAGYTRVRGPRSWHGPECLMCNGTGRHTVVVTEPRDGPFQEVVGKRLTDLRCGACNGHGRDPS